MKFMMENRVAGRNETKLRFGGAARNRPNGAGGRSAVA